MHGIVFHDAAANTDKTDNADNHIHEGHRRNDEDDHSSFTHEPPQSDNRSQSP